MRTKEKNAEYVLQKSPLNIFPIEGALLKCFLCLIEQQCLDRVVITPSD